jgi:hypothetical protein
MDVAEDMRLLGQRQLYYLRYCLHEHDVCQFPAALLANMLQVGPDGYLHEQILTGRTQPFYCE